MISYRGRHAQLYDLFYRDKNYVAEAAFVHGCIRRFLDLPGRHLVDLACGTGRHAVAFHRLGYAVTGVDHSESMLEVARENARREEAAVSFRHGDLRDLGPLGGPWDVATCLFDSIGYVRTNEALEAVFQGIREAVQLGGLLILEYWHAGAMLRSYDPVRVRRWEDPTGAVLRISETSLDCAHQTATVKYNVYEHRADGTYTHFEESQSNRFFLVQEMHLWLSANGFIPLACFDGFTERPVSQDTWHVVAVAKRSLGARTGKP